MAASSSGPKLVPKPSLDQYVFSEKLGSGTYATVYKAYRKTGIREVVAIKCVLKSSLNKGSTDNLLTEIEILKKLQHDYIVTLKDFYWDANYIYLIMEYCSGGDLSRFVKSKRALPEHIVKRFLQQIASAMKFLWDNNIAHMDLKPQNILLSSSSTPQIKLADFGFAKPLYDGDSLHVMRGSPLYMAPEIICHKKYDNRVDLWSIGVILYECLFGKAPFASKSFKELEEKIWDGKPVEIPLGFNISDSSRHLLLGLLKRDPDERISFEEFFADPFVDMEHLPSKDSLPVAVKIVSKAVEEDKNGNFKSAIQLYCEALSFFVPAIHYEKNSRKKNVLREKVKSYMDRAEVLKQMMKPQGPTTTNHHNNHQTTPTPENPPSLSELSICDSAAPCQHKSSLPARSTTLSEGFKSSTPSVLTTKPTPQHTDSTQELYSLCLISDELMAALRLIKNAEMEERCEDFLQCLNHYEMGLEALLKLLHDEPKGRRKELLSMKISEWMKKAEVIKSYLEVQQLDTAHNSQLLQEEETEMSQSKQCLVQ